METEKKKKTEGRFLRRNKGKILYGLFILAIVALIRAISESGIIQKRRFIGLERHIVLILLKNCDRSPLSDEKYASVFACSHTAAIKVRQKKLYRLQSEIQQCIISL